MPNDKFYPQVIRNNQLDKVEVEKALRRLYDMIYNTTTSISSGNAPHASTHYNGGADELDINLLGGFTGSTTLFLRADGTFALPTGAAGITQLTGDVTATGPGPVAATIANDAVTNAKMANMAEERIKGRAVGAGTGDPQDLTPAQATAILDELVGDSGAGGTKGLAPAPAAGDAAADKFLHADGTWQTPAGGGSETSTTAVGSEPGSPTDGDLDFYNNGFAVARYNGSIWDPWGPIYPLTAPVNGDFSWDNQTGASVVTTNGGIHLAIPATISGLHVRYKTAPSPPYTITACFLPAILVNVTASQAVGICFRQSGTGELMSFEIATQTSTIQLQGLKWDSSTAFNSSYFAHNAYILGSPMWLRIADDNTNRICSYSVDGVNFFAVHSVGRTDFLTADQVGFCGYTNTTQFGCGMTLLSWVEA